MGVCVCVCVRERDLELHAAAHGVHGVRQDVRLISLFAVQF